MSELDRLSLSETLSYLTDKDAQRQLLTKINETIKAGEFTEETLSTIGGLVIDGMKLKDLFERNIEAKRLVKKDGKIMFPDSKGGEENGK